jgi:hypothetical protein
VYIVKQLKVKNKGEKLYNDACDHDTASNATCTC